MCNLLLACAILLGGVNVMRERPAVEYVSKPRGVSACSRGCCA
jgi:hypothetical protein